MFEGFPYTNFHDLNLDWIIQKIKEAYSPENPPENVVVSVNGETGEVILYKNAFVALPDVESDVWNIYRGVDGSAEGIQFKKNSPMQRVNGVNRYNVYDQGNPPPYPVRSVNGQTGDVAISVPVQSVNGQTGNVILYRDAQIVFPGVDSTSWSMARETDTSPAVGIRFTEDGPAKRIDDDQSYDIYDEGNPPPYPVTSVGTLTGAVAILDTTIVTDGGTQKLKITFPVTSVDGLTGVVKTWANSANAMLKTPADSEGDAWGIVRGVPSGDTGIRFEYSNNELTGYLYFDDGTNPVVKTKILTPADIPSSSGVVSVNGLTGVVTVNGSNLDMSGTDTRKIGTVVQALQDNLAQEYDSTTTYDKGELVIYQNQLYQCAADISTAEAWTAAHWNMVDLDILSRNKDQKIANNTAAIGNNTTAIGNNTTAIGKLALDMASAYDDTATYNVGDYCIYSNQLYKCNTAIAVAESFTPAHWTACNITGELAGAGSNLGPAVAANTASIGHIEEGIAIIVNGDVASAAVPVGGYAYIKNNTHGLTEGLYTNTGASAFPTTGGTADSTTFTAATDALNALNSKLKNQEIYRLSQAGSLNNEVDSGISEAKMTEFDYVTMGLIMQGNRFFHMFTFPTSIWNENDLSTLEGSDQSLVKGCGIKHNSSGNIYYYAGLNAILIFSN